MAPQLSSTTMGNVFTECINPESLTAAATGAATQLFERQLRTGKVDESDVFGVLSDQFKLIANKKIKTTEGRSPPKDFYNVSNWLSISALAIFTSNRIAQANYSHALA